ncbi:MAG: VanZ family protein [bacterium]|nr:VanZ family protein [bacterium]
MSELALAAVRERNRFWEAAATIWSAAVLGLAVSPLRNVDLITAPISDKVLHAIAFLFGIMVWAGALERYPRRGHSLSLAVAICVAMGGLIELLQSQTLTRSSEMGDFVADLAGIAMGASLWILLRFRARPVA